MLRIREVNIADQTVRETLYALIAQCFDAEDWSGGTLPTPQTGYWWLAFQDGVPVAFAGLVPSVRWQDTGVLSIAGVLPAARGSGLQKKLIRKRIEKCKALGWHTIITDTINTNAASMRSLMACGFKPYNPKVQWADKDSSVYWKRATEFTRA